MVRKKAPILIYFSLAVICTVHHIARTEGFQLSIHSLLYPAVAFIFLCAPFIYICIDGILFHEVRIKKNGALHFFPFSAYFAVPFFFSGVRFDSKCQDCFYSVFFMLSFLVWSIYVFLTAYKILNFRSSIKYCYLSSKPALEWMQCCNLFFFTLLAGFFINYFTERDFAITFLIISCLTGLVPVLIVMLFYFKKQEDYHKENLIFSYQQKAMQFPVKDYSENERLLILAKMDSVFADQKFFLIKDLTVREAARKIGIPSTKISKFIYSEFGFNFSDYVNMLRIEYFKQRIREPEFKAAGLAKAASQCGFNSRTTFFRAFIKNEGKSPSEYLKT